MIYEGVNFNGEEVRKLSRDEFVASHKAYFWRDRDEATREKMLTEVYGLICKPAAKTKRKSEK